MEMKTSGPLSGPPFGPISFFQGRQTASPSPNEYFFSKLDHPGEKRREATTVWERRVGQSEIH